MHRALTSDEAAAANNRADLIPNRANYVPLSPLSFLWRSERAYGNKTAVIDGERQLSYFAFAERVRKAAGFLRDLGVGHGHVVSVLAPNSIVLLEAHYAVPLAGALLNALNTRLDAAGIAYILDHSQSGILIVDEKLLAVARDAVAQSSRAIRIIVAGEKAQARGQDLLDYEDGLLRSKPWIGTRGPAEEWDFIAVNYTSGTTGRPKGVVYHHRGAYLNALGNALVLNLTAGSVFLWALPMFHCNGWTYTWAVTAVGGTHVCLRNVESVALWRHIHRHAVTHICGAPIVLQTILGAPGDIRTPLAHPVLVGTGGAPPPPSVLAEMEALGFRVIHLYGLTEVYGPATIAAEQPDWKSQPLEVRAALAARQGVPLPTLEDARIADPETGELLAPGGQSLGEVILRSNTVMAGYLHDPAATQKAFRDGWFHTGDLGVQNPDGFIELRDRLKDIIISGGENISSIEVEAALLAHPSIKDAAVVAAPHPKWGETPYAFVSIHPDGAAPTTDELRQWCRTHLAHFKVPSRFIFASIERTSTGKLQKHIWRDEARRLAASD